MKKYILTLTLLFFCFGFSSPHRGIIARKNDTYTPPTCTTTNITFWWRCEALDFSATDGTLDYSAGDNIADAYSGAAINTAAVKIGTNGLDIPTVYDYVDFAVSLEDIVSSAEGRIGFWWRYTTWGDDAGIIRVTDSSPIFEIELNLTASDELEFKWYDNGTQRTTLTSSSSPLPSSGTWYFIEMAWKASTAYREIFVNGISAGTSSATIANASVSVNLFQIGETNSVAVDYHTDQIFISSSSTDNLYPCRDETEWPE